MLLESAICNCDGFQITKDDVEKIMDWGKTVDEKVEIPFKPARVILQVYRYIHDLNTIGYRKRNIFHVQSFIMILCN